MMGIRLDRRDIAAIMVVLGVLALAAAAWLSRPAYRVQEAPMEASAAQGVTCVDLDGDGVSDAVLIQRATILSASDHAVRAWPCSQAPAAYVLPRGGWVNADAAFWTREGK